MIRPIVLIHWAYQVVKNNTYPLFWKIILYSSLCNETSSYVVVITCHILENAELFWRENVLPKLLLTLLGLACWLTAVLEFYHVLTNCNLQFYTGLLIRLEKRVLLHVRRSWGHRQVWYFFTIVKLTGLQMLQTIPTYHTLTSLNMCPNQH